MKKRERSVGFYEVTIRTVAAEKINFEPTQSNFLEVFEKLVPFIRASRIIGTRYPIELVDFEYKKKSNQLFLLFNKVNPELPEIGLYKRGTKIRRNPTKDTDEDREQSSHMLITPINNTNKARVLITKGAGIGPDCLKRLFSDIYKDYKNNKDLLKIRNRIWPTHTIENTGGKKNYLVNHSFEISGEPSESLANILDGQAIAEIDMIDNRDLSIDGTSLKVDKRTFTLTGKAIPKTVTGLKGLFQKAMDQFQIEIDHLRIVYEEDINEEAVGINGTANQESGEHIDSQKKTKKAKSLSYAQIDQFFTRSDKIILSTDHAETQTKLSSEICEKLLKL